jgi:hypothetical protein
MGGDGIRFPIVWKSKLASGTICFPPQELGVMVIIICDIVPLLDTFLFALSVPFLGVNYVQGCSTNSSHTHTSLKDTKKSPNTQHICFEPYVTLTYLWWSINQRQETRIKPYWKRVAIKTNCLSLSTQKQNSEYLFHFTICSCSFPTPSSMP